MKLFSLKSLSFGQCAVVTGIAQRFALVFMILLNIAFVGLTIVRCLVRDANWQRYLLLIVLLILSADLCGLVLHVGRVGYFVSLFIELFVEIAFFETTGRYIIDYDLLRLYLECLWIHYIMPNLVRHDVEDAVRTLYSSLDMAFSNTMPENLVFNMPQYLFVSTQVESQ